MRPRRAGYGRPAGAFGLFSAMSELRRRIFRAGRQGMSRGLRTAGWLLRFMLPVSLLVALLEHAGLLGRLGAWLAPLFRRLGLPGEAALVFVSGTLLNLYSAIAVMVTLGLDQRQVTVVALFLLVAHNLPVEAAVQHRAGTPAWILVPLRLAAGLAAAFLLSYFLPGAGPGPVHGPAPAVAVAAATPGGFLAGWVRGAFPLVLRVAIIVSLVMAGQRLLEEFGVFTALARRLGPLMRLLGLPPAGAFLWLVTNTLGLAYGAAVILDEARSRRLSRAEIDRLNRSVAVCHSLLEDTLLFVAVGAWWPWITLPRLLLAALVARADRLAVRWRRRRRSFSVLILCSAGLAAPGVPALAAGPAVSPAPLQTAPPWTAVLAGGTSASFENALPGEATVAIPLDADWFRRSRLSFRLTVAPGAPADLAFIVYLKDRDWWWFQTVPRPAPAGRETEVRLDLTAAGGQWQPHGHRRAWNVYTTDRARELGVKFFSARPGPLAVTLEAFELGPAAAAAAAPPPVRLLAAPPAVIGRHELFELRLDIPRAFANPFDPACVALEAVFSAPDGRETVLPAFFYQGYYFAGPAREGRDDLRPEGAPEWRVRFTPDQVGRYRYRLRLAVDGGRPRPAGPAGEFRVRRSARPGFVRVSGRDRRYFEFADGRFFYPLGQNIRSLNDLRYAALRHLPPAAPGGTREFADWLERMAASGQNFFETWQAAWWLGLEWLADVDAYQGIGRYNLVNAWKLDWLLGQAAAADIFLQLLIINHGALSTYCDEEWDDHPYNRDRGGFLDSPEEFFSDARARALFRRRLRYIVARWAYSPHVFGWEILNEMNLVGASRSFYRQPLLTDWYREMAAGLKELDPWQRPITGHYTILYDSDIFRLPEVDYVVTNAYYPPRENIVDTLKRISEYNSRFGKPHFVSEFGGNWDAGPDELLVADLHNGLWAGYHLPFAGTPLFWWHNFITDRDLDETFAALARYHAGEDRLAAPLAPRDVVLAGARPGQLAALCLAGDSRALAWFYAPERLQRPPRDSDIVFTDGVVASLDGLSPGLYLLEFWDTRRGRSRMRRYRETCPGGRLSFALPRANRDFALKLRRLGPAGPP